MRPCLERAVQQRHCSIGVNAVSLGACRYGCARMQLEASGDMLGDRRETVRESGGKGAQRGGESLRWRKLCQEGDTVIEQPSWWVLKATEELIKHGRVCEVRTRLGRSWDSKLRVAQGREFQVNERDGRGHGQMGDRPDDVLNRGNTRQAA